MDCQLQADSAEKRDHAGSLSSWMGDRAVCDLALDKIKQGLCVLDGHQRLQLFNRRYAEMFGIRPEAFRLGMSLLEVIRLRYEAGFGFVMSSDDYLAYCNKVGPVKAIEITCITL